MISPLWPLHDPDDDEPGSFWNQPLPIPESRTGFTFVYVLIVAFGIGAGVMLVQMIIERWP